MERSTPVCPPVSPAASVPALSVIVPASNEAALIAECLRALAASDPVPGGVEVIVVANGCRDDTAARARDRAPDFAARGWRLVVRERADGGKLAALNDGDAAAAGAARAYLDADVRVSPPLLPALAAALATDAPRYASGTLRIARARSWASRAYARIWARVPFMSTDVPGCGLFAVNAAGRARWGAFPDIVSDDTFVRLNFAPSERVAVPAPYDWPVVEGLPALVRVRRRQDRGVAEIAARFPALAANDNKPPFPLARKLRLALSDPLGFAVYSGVALAVRLSPRGPDGWSRGR
ncbi:glycosyltransferase [Roseivivax isoporae]|uniref:Glycosyl transferase n=1 Tax=Roseivivax isoporae LMG 25204 TaxID=1449351 RepID=X7FBY2_9RHOB|nr:glycosyltransferase family 2 protein [Roseivivax isoporae]ETX30427.1 glycosyl transferase [Roseivivax isoporae LMG 25204]